MSHTFSGKALTWVLEGGRILDVTLHREPCNEIGTIALEELEALAALVKDGAGGARAMVMRSTVPAGFSAGADLRELYAGLLQTKQDPEAGRREVRRFIDRIHDVMDTLDAAPMTVIAAAHGVVFGGGLELALTADVIVADKSARFAFPELRLGLIPGFGGIPRLRRDVGNAVVRDLLMTGRSLGAARAHAVGLVAQLVARDQSHKAARALAEQACRFDRHTASAAKAFMKPIPRSELAQEKDLFCKLFASPVVEAALAKFCESTEVRPYLP